MTNILEDNTDMLKEILSHLDNKSVCSMLLINKYTNALRNNYKDNIIKYAVQRELNHVNQKEIVYDKYHVVDFGTGDRIIITLNENNIVTKKNFIVWNREGMIAELKHVDMFGNILDNITYQIKLMYCQNKKGYDWKSTNMIVFPLHIITPGILLCDNGPKIINIHSRYLKYKTTIQNDANPEINMIVEIKYVYTNERIIIMEYVITKLNDIMTLEYLYGNTENIIYILYAQKIDILQPNNNINNWKIIKDNYYIKKFGSFRTCDCCL